MKLCHGQNRCMAFPSVQDGVGSNRERYGSVPLGEGQREYR